MALTGSKLGRSFASEVRWGKTRYFNQDYSDRVLREVEHLACRVRQLKRRLAKLLGTCPCPEFKCSVEEEDGDSQCNRDYQRIEAT